MLPAFTKVQTKNIELSQAEDALKECLDTITDVEWLDGALLEDVDLSSGLNLLPHTLQRKLRGYWVVRASADVRIWDDATTSDVPERLHRLQASAAATVSLWVF
jgi:hypothetical protein